MQKSGKWKNEEMEKQEFEKKGKKSREKKRKEEKGMKTCRARSKIENKM